MKSILGTSKCLVSKWSRAAKVHLLGVVSKRREWGAIAEPRM